MLKKSLFLFFVLIFVFNIQALEVRELNLGACWAKKFDQNGYVSWKFAHFNDSSAFSINQTLFRIGLEPKIVSQLKTMNISRMEAAKMKAGYFCSGSGNFLNFEIPKSKELPALCASFKETEAGIVFAKLLPQHTQNNGPCFGQATGSLIVFLKPDLGEKTVQLAIRKIRKQNFVKKTQLVFKTMVLVTLESSENFKEDNAKQKLENLLTKKYLKHISYDDIVVAAGEGYMLDPFEFSGF